MKVIKYFFEFLIILLLFSIFKVIGFKSSSKIGKIIGKYIGPFTRPKNKIKENLRKSNLIEDDNHLETTIENMWGNYGRIFAEYPFLKGFRNDELKSYIEIEGINILNDIKKNNKQVVFISGHFNNFELMAMQIEKSGVKLAAIYRPLNNIFLNKIMENIRTKYICKEQIKKGKSGTRELIQLFKKGYSVALMIDQRVSEGEEINFFNRKCYTTTIPAQLVKKYGCEVVPVYIERKDQHYFKLYFEKPLSFEEKENIQSITLKLNKLLEKMVAKNLDQWIWTHDRWK